MSDHYVLTWTDGDHQQEMLLTTSEHTALVFSEALKANGMTNVSLMCNQMTVTEVAAPVVDTTSDAN